MRTEGTFILPDQASESLAHTPDAMHHSVLPNVTDLEELLLLLERLHLAG